MSPRQLVLTPAPQMGLREAGAHRTRRSRTPRGQGTRSRGGGGTSADVSCVILRESLLRHLGLPPPVKWGLRPPGPQREHVKPESKEAFTSQTVAMCRPRAWEQSVGSASPALCNLGQVARRL